MYKFSLQLRYSLFALLLAFAITGCNEHGSQDMQYESGASAPSEMATADAHDEVVMEAEESSAGGAMNRADKKSVPTQAANLVEKAEPAPAPMRIYTANIEMQVEDLAKAAADARKLAQKHNAWLGSEKQAREYNKHSIAFTFRTPPKEFDALVSELEALGIQTTHKSITTEDVGVQYADLAARMKHKKAVADQYEQLLRRSGTIQDILNVQAELSRVQEEIESTEGRMRFLQRQVSFSTIDVTLYVPVESAYNPRPGFWGELASAFTGGWRTFQDLILFFVKGWPIFIPLALLAFWLIRRRRLQKTELANRTAVKTSTKPDQEAE